MKIDLETCINCYDAQKILPMLFVCNKWYCIPRSKQLKLAPYVQVHLSWGVVGFNQVEENRNIVKQFFSFQMARYQYFISEVLVYKLYFGGKNKTGQGGQPTTNSWIQPAAIKSLTSLFSSVFRSRLQMLDRFSIKLRGAWKTRMTFSSPAEANMYRLIMVRHCMS